MLSSTRDPIMSIYHTVATFGADKLIIYLCNYYGLGGGGGGGVMVLNATFNNISVLLVEETGVPGKNHRPAINYYVVS